jgi:hypothetical protein
LPFIVVFSVGFYVAVLGFFAIVVAVFASYDITL